MWLYKKVKQYLEIKLCFWTGNWNLKMPVRNVVITESDSIILVIRPIEFFGL